MKHRTLFRAPSPYRRIAGTWLVTRVIAIASIALTPRLLDDIDIYRGWLPFLHGSAFPTSDPKWQYPPGAGAVLLAPDLLHADYAVAFTVLCLLVDAAILALLVMANARRPDASTRGLWLWALAALVVGPIMFTRFDIVPTLFAVACVLLAARPVLAGASAALGFVVKVWPALMILSLPRSRSVKAWVAFVASTAVVLGLFATRFDGVLSFVGNQRSRGLQVEAVGALPFELYSLAGGRVSYGLEYGSYQVLMNGAEQIGTIISLLGLGLIALMAWWRFRGRLDVLPAGDVALTLVLISVATSRVYSPQYNVWLIGVCSVALLSPVTRMTRVAAILIATSLVTQLVYPWFPYDLTDGNIWIVAVQCLRIAGLCAATVLAVREMARAGRREPTVRTPASTLVSS